MYPPCPSVPGLTGKPNFTTWSEWHPKQSDTFSTRYFPRASRAGVPSSFSVDAAKLQFSNKSDLRAYYVVEQTGFDRNLPETEIKNGLELLREYVDAKGNPVKSVKVGEEIEVRLKFRALNRKAIDNAALVDPEAELVPFK